MPDPVFFNVAQDFSLRDVFVLAGLDPADPQTGLTEADEALRFRGVAALADAGPADIAYMDNPRYLADLKATRAGLCLVSPRFAKSVPAATRSIVLREPYGTYAALLRAFFPAAARPGSGFGATGVSPGANIHPTARLEQGVVVDPGAVIGPRVEIGRGTVVGACAVIGPDCKIGRDCSISAHVSLQHALLGNRVILHPGVRIGQDGFGYAFEKGRHQKVPQIGRVIVQDDVEIGANSTVDRGANRDTVIGEGTKIDNLVQIAHNVVIGRHCIIVSQTGISGSTILEDYVVLAGQVGVVGHVRIGAGSQIAGSSNVAKDVPPGSRWGGTPAKPVREWFREMTTLKRLAARRGASGDDDGA